MDDPFHANIVLARQHGIIDSVAGYGLSLTHTHAIVWPYSATIPSPETFSFTLPYPSKNLSDPLPLGCLVSPSASAAEPGLVVVMPQTGKVTYWESISSAVTLDFMRQQGNGIDESIHGMFSGEIVTHIVNADSAGFVLAFNSGRLAYMSVRDPQGKPAVNVQFLRSTLGSTASGLLGSIRHVFSHATTRGDIVALRADKSYRVGERVVAVVTTKGKIQGWKVHRGGHHELVVDTDIREMAVEDIQKYDEVSRSYPADSFEIVDMTFIPRGLEDRYRAMSRLSDALGDGESTRHLLLLVSFTAKQQSRYVLAELIVTPEKTLLGAIRPLTTYSTPVSPYALERPRLYLPRPALVAFVVFDRAFVVASLAKRQEQPDWQLQGELYKLQSDFEDVTDLREDPALEIVGSGLEEPLGSDVGPDELRVGRQRPHGPAVVLLVRGVGVLRAAATDVERFASDTPPKITAKNKLEQAVFFGIKDDNPLAFERRRAAEFTDREIGEAAKALCDEILKSTTPYISTLPASLEFNLRGRLSAVEKLMLHIQIIGAELDRDVKWTLLAGAEKLSVAIYLWRLHERLTASRPDDNKKTLIAEIVEYIHADQKKDPNRAAGEVDALRHWFINDVWRLEIFLAWAYEVIKYVYKDRLQDESGIARLIVEAMNVYSGAIDAAIEYRTDRLDLFGLQDEKLDPTGILDGATGNWAGLPEPWTATHLITNNVKRLVELSFKFVNTHWGQPTAPGAPDAVLIETMRMQLPTLTDRLLVCLQEFSRWAVATGDSKTTQWGEYCASLYHKELHERLIQLTAFELWDEAIAVAERHQAMSALADILVSEAMQHRDISESVGAVAGAPDKAKEWEEDMAKIGHYMDLYKQPFAFAAYDLLLRRAGIEDVLAFPFDKHGYLTQFLRGKEDLAKISWINDVEREEDIGRAAETLLDIGISKEKQVWNRKIELSLSKLARLAELPATPSVDGFQATLEAEEKEDAGLRRIDHELGLIKIQDTLYSQILQTIRVALDESAELELALETHGADIPKHQKGLVQVFKDGMGRLLKHEALDALVLIDLLTLFTPRPDSKGDFPNQFYLALCAADYALRGEEHQLVESLIWRRCLNKDNWASINNTQTKADEAVVDALADTCLFDALFTCLTLGRQPRNTTVTTIANKRECIGRIKEVSYKSLKASNCLGVYTETLPRRYRDMDTSFQDRLLEGMKWEDSVLRENIEKNRLDEWVRTTVESAEAAAREFMNEETKAGAASGPKSIHGPDGSRPRAKKPTLMNGNSTKTNGKAAGATAWSQW